MTEYPSIRHAPLLRRFFRKRDVRKMIEKRLNMPEMNHLISRKNILESMQYLDDGYDVDVIYHERKTHIESEGEPYVMMQMDVIGSGVPDELRPNPHYREREEEDRPAHIEIARGQSLA